MNNVERTVDLFASGLNCSQAILTVLGEPYGLDSKMAARLGRPLGGGMGRLSLTCGAVTASRAGFGSGEGRPGRRRGEESHVFSMCKNSSGVLRLCTGRQNAEACLEQI